MEKLVHVRNARYLRNHTLHLEFEDGLQGEVDLADYPRRGPIFKPLADVDFFRQFSLEGGTLTWPNSADIAPERFYEMVLARANPHLEPAG
jgi:hypothetical protein